MAVEASPWGALAPGKLRQIEARPWVIPAVYRRLQGGAGSFLAEFRASVALFVQFLGIDYEADDAGELLDSFVRWVQTVLDREDGSFIQLTIGDKGSYLYAAFGTPVARPDAALRAVTAGLALITPPGECGFISQVSIGIAAGLMRTGAYGSKERRTYGVLGDKVNLAARLMQAASGSILCDTAVYQATRDQVQFEALPAISLKGKSEPVAIYRPLAIKKAGDFRAIVDQLEPDSLTTLKVASIIGYQFSEEILLAVHPSRLKREDLQDQLVQLESRALIRRLPVTAEGNGEQGAHFFFISPLVHEIADEGMLFAHRRQLHRQVAEWFEMTYIGDLDRYFALLAHHWRQAENNEKSMFYLEQAGEQARRNGEQLEALRLLQAALALERQPAEVSGTYWD
jgi:class 3 adenylate cyclase